MKYPAINVPTLHFKDMPQSLNIYGQGSGDGLFSFKPTENVTGVYIFTCIKMILQFI